ncbi:MAG: histidine kinase [Pseudolabrys sp.]
MPSLFRFLFVVAILCGAGYAVVYSLAHFVPLKPREITVTITPDKFLKR